MAGPFTGRVAVVTGGASGIGEACVRLLTARGAQTVIADRDIVKADTVATSIGAAAFAVDVSDESAVELLADQVERDVGPVDILVTSAGIGQTPVPPDELPIEVWDRITTVNLRGTWVSCIAFGRRMAQRSRGSIVTIASVSGLRATPLHAYGPGKAAVASLSAGLAVEWGRSGVRVNAVSPGFVRTPLLVAQIEAGRRDVQLIEHNSALGRMVEPEEVAKTVAFLASDEAAAITGINMPVDAGWLAAGGWLTYGGVRQKRE